MKNITITAVIILLLILLNSCQTTKYGFTKQELEKNYEFVERIMKNIDSLNIILNDTSKVVTTISKYADIIEIEKNWLKEYLLESKFLDGYDYVDENIFFIGYSPESTNIIDNNVIKIYTHGIKLKSRYNGEIIWFLFQNEEPKVWKYSSFAKCNNFIGWTPELEPVVPCDKK